MIGCDKDQDRFEEKLGSELKQAQLKAAIDPSRIFGQPRPSDRTWPKAEWQLPQGRGLPGRSPPRPFIYRRPSIANTGRTTSYKAFQNSKIMIV
jgi:hypothetical protein